jgi:hypothetical protein
MRSYLVVGNQTLDSPELAKAIKDRVRKGAASFHLVVPTTPIEHLFTWDEEEARALAEKRLNTALDRLRGLGVEVSGEIGPRDPVEATVDALRRRSVDEILLSTLPVGLSRWLGQDVPTRMKGAVNVPVSVVTAARASVAAS